jgi:hypothetical protein
MLYEMDSSVVTNAVVGEFVDLIATPKNNCPTFGASTKLILIGSVALSVPPLI